MTKIDAINMLRADLKVTLNGGNDKPKLTIERILSPEAKTKISLRADEWQELVDWIRAITLLYEQNQNTSLHRINEIAF